MQINVGTVLTMKGIKWYCVSIEVYKKTSLAGDWDVINWSNYILSNTYRVQVLAQEQAFLERGEIYTREYEKLEFKELDGSEWLTIYTYHKIKKEKQQNGSQGTESSNQQATSGQVESSGQGNSDRDSVRGEGAG